MVWNVILNDKSSPLSSALPDRGGVLLWARPLAQHIYWYGLPGLSPPQNQTMKKMEEAKEEKTKNEPEMKICEHTKSIANTN